MSKPNTLHIIGFAVKLWNVNPPAVVEPETYNGYYELNFIEEDYFE